MERLKKYNSVIVHVLSGFLKALLLIDALLIVYLVVICCYKFSKSPESVFEEMYFSAIDCSSLSALGYEGGGGVWPPRDYTLPALDPNIDYSLVAMGAKRSPSLGSLDEVLFSRSNSGLLYEYPIDAFNDYYGRYLYEVDKDFSFASGRHGKLSVIEINREGTGEANRILYIDFTLLNASNCSEIALSKDGNTVAAPPPVDARVWFDLDSNELSLTVSHCEHIGDEEAIESAKSVVFDVLIPDYLSASEVATYSLGNLGEWSWGEISVRDANYVTSEKDHG